MVPAAARLGQLGMKLQPSLQAAQHVDTCARQLAGCVRASAVLLQLHSTARTCWCSLAWRRVCKSWLLLGLPACSSLQRKCSQGLVVMWWGQTSPVRRDRRVWRMIWRCLLWFMLRVALHGNKSRSTAGSRELESWSSPGRACCRG